MNVSELPMRTPVWGIAYMPDSEHGEHVGLWQRWTDEDGTEVLVEMECAWDRYPVESVTDFVPLTVEQAEQMEAHG